MFLINLSSEIRVVFCLGNSHGEAYIIYYSYEMLNYKFYS